MAPKDGALRAKLQELQQKDEGTLTVEDVRKAMKELDRTQPGSVSTEDRSPRPYSSGPAGGEAGEKAAPNSTTADALFPSTPSRGRTSGARSIATPRSRIARTLDEATSSPSPKPLNYQVPSWEPEESPLRPKSASGSGKRRKDRAAEEDYQETPTKRYRHSRGPTRTKKAQAQEDEVKEGEEASGDKGKANATAGI